MINAGEVVVTMPQYGSPAYWDARYAADPMVQHDWYQTAETLSPYRTSLLNVSQAEDLEILVKTSEILAKTWKCFVKSVTTTFFTAQ